MEGGGKELTSEDATASSMVTLIGEEKEFKLISEVLQIIEFAVRESIWHG